MASPRISLLMIALLVVVLAAKGAEGQSPTPSCVTNLVPCAEYFNSTKPPESCCTPLKDAVLHQLDCLCNLYGDPALLKAFSINITQALLLPGHCGIPGDLSACKAMAPGSSTPPATPGRNDGNGVGRIASAAGLSTFFLFGVSLMFW